MSYIVVCISHSTYIHCPLEEWEIENVSRSYYYINETSKIAYIMHCVFICLINSLKWIYKAKASGVFKLCKNVHIALSEIDGNCSIANNIRISLLSYTYLHLIFINFMNQEMYCIVAQIYMCVCVCLFPCIYLYVIFKYKNLPKKILGP
jgi:hypothetical protein